MIVESQVDTKLGNGLTLSKKKKEFVRDEIVDKTAEKKQAILDIITEGTQLTLLGTLVEQIGDQVGLDTPEFTQAKAVFAEIKNILNG